MALLSDGKENLGSAEWAARLAGANGVPVDVVSLPSLSGPEVWLAGLAAPSSVREGEHVSLEVSVSATADTTATLTILMDGAPITIQPVSLVRGSNKFVQQLPPAVRGFHTYSATVDAQPGSDTRRENNRYSAFSLVLGKPHMLLVEGHEGEASALQAALAPGVQADVVPPSAMPTDLSALAGYDGIILVNVPASSLSKTTMDNLQIVVRDLGKGLVVIGGDESYAAGGYFRTPLEAMLPVDLNLPSKLDIPSVGMVLVIDRSGSMEMAHTGSTGVAKIELAKEAASQAVCATERPRLRRRDHLRQRRRLGGAFAATGRSRQLQEQDRQHLLRRRHEHLRRALPGRRRADHQQSQEQAHRAPYRRGIGGRRLRRPPQEDGRKRHYPLNRSCRRRRQHRPDEVPG